MLAALVLAASLAACGSDDGSTPTTTTASITTPGAADATTTTPTATTAAPDGPITVGQLAAVVCDTEPTRMDAAAETFTAASWECTHKGESVRIDLYADADQQRDAIAVTVDVLGKDADALPIFCGDRWAIGVDYNATRDQLLADLTAAGIDASTC